jgi:hypothetical protein
VFFVKCCGGRFQKLTQEDLKTMQRKGERGGGGNKAGKGNKGKGKGGKGKAGKGTRKEL